MSPAVVPFVVSRSHDVIKGPEVTSTVETSHGLLHLEQEGIRAQWSTTREVSRVGREIRVDSDAGPVNEVFIPLRGLAGAAVKKRLLSSRLHLVLRASDLRAFAELAGRTGMSLAHPAELVLEIPGRDREALNEFVADLNLAIAEIALDT